MFLLIYWKISKMQKNIFIASVSSQYLGFFLNPSVNRLFLLFVYLRTFRKNKCYIYIYEKYNNCHNRKRMCTYLYIYKKQKKLPNVFIHKLIYTSQKSGHFPLCFYVQNNIHFTLRNFSWNFWSCHLYTKILTLCVTWRFIYRNTSTSQKARKFAFCF